MEYNVVSAVNLMKSKDYNKLAFTKVTPEQMQLFRGYLETLFFNNIFVVDFSFDFLDLLNKKLLVLNNHNYYYELKKKIEYLENMMKVNPASAKYYKFMIESLTKEERSLLHQTPEFGLTKYLRILLVIEHYILGTIFEKIFALKKELLQDLDISKELTYFKSFKNRSFDITKFKEFMENCFAFSRHCNKYDENKEEVIIAFLNYSNIEKYLLKNYGNDISLDKLRFTLFSIQSILVELFDIGGMPAKLVFVTSNDDLSICGNINENLIADSIRLEVMENNSLKLLNS